MPDLDFLADYSQRFSVNLHWLISGKGEMFQGPLKPRGGTDRLGETKQIKKRALEEMPASRSASSLVIDWAPNDFVRLPQYDVKASAGTGLVAINQMPVSEVAFERAFLRSLGGAPDHCFLMWSSGPSMLPTIHDDSLMIVDASQTAVDDGRIYVFSVGNAVLVKRARWRMDGKLELTSDNKEMHFPVEIFDADRVEDLVVVGRVIFVGHRPI